ncbi:MAG: hypothetical protein ACK55Z_06805, partial [bacterium]
MLSCRVEVDDSRAGGLRRALDSVGTIDSNGLGTLAPQAAIIIIYAVAATVSATIVAGVSAVGVSFAATTT